MKQLVEKNAECPDIDVVIIFSFEEHFWCHVLVGSTEGCSLHIDILGSPSKIADFDVPVTVKE